MCGRAQHEFEPDSAFGRPRDRAAFNRDFSTRSPRAHRLRKGGEARLQGNKPALFLPEHPPENRIHMFEVVRKIEEFIEFGG